MTVLNYFKYNFECGFRNFGILSKAKYIFIMFSVVNIIMFTLLVEFIGCQGLFLSYLWFLVCCINSFGMTRQQSGGKNFVLPPILGFPFYFNNNIFIRLIFIRFTRMRTLDQFQLTVRTYNITSSICVMFGSGCVIVTNLKSMEYNTKKRH